MTFLPVVVRVEKRDEVGVGSGNTEVPGGRDAAVRLREVRHGRTVCSHDGRGVVPGAVVDDDDLVGRVLLAQDALDRTPEKVSAIVKAVHDLRNEFIVDLPFWRLTANRFAVFARSRAA